MHLVISEDNAPLQYMWRHTELQQLQLNSLSCGENHPDRNEMFPDKSESLGGAGVKKIQLHRVFVSK